MGADAGYVYAAIAHLAIGSAKKSRDQLSAARWDRALGLQRGPWAIERLMAMWTRGEPFAEKSPWAEKRGIGLFQMGGTG